MQNFNQTSRKFRNCIFETVLDENCDTVLQYFLSSCAVLHLKVKFMNENYFRTNTCQTIRFNVPSNARTVCLVCDLSHAKNFQQPAHATSKSYHRTKKKDGHGTAHDIRKGQQSTHGAEAERTKAQFSWAKFPGNSFVSRIFNNRAVAAKISVFQN